MVGFKPTPPPPLQVKFFLTCKVGQGVKKYRHWRRLGQGVKERQRQRDRETERHTVKLGYNEQLGAAKFVHYNWEFIITGAFYGIILRFGTEKFVHYNREFVIIEFDCIKKVSQRASERYRNTERHKNRNRERQIATTRERDGKTDSGNKKKR